MRSHPIRLSSGAWLAPNSDEDGAWRPRVDVSHDEGETFERLSDIPLNTTDEAAPDYLPGLGAIQPTLWESAPGHVHALLRTTGGYVCPLGFRRLWPDVEPRAQDRHTQ